MEDHPRADRLEMVENLVHRGLEVTLVERHPQVMPPLEPEVAAAQSRERCATLNEVNLQKQSCPGHRIWFKNPASLTAGPGIPSRQD